jgi:tRNA(Ile)-lysidine synthase
MIQEIRKFLKDYNLLDAQKTFLVGFSGGFDSMCLLDCLNNIRKDFGFRLVAIHLNHNWRGESALKEQENCKKYCEKNNIEFYTETLSDDVKKTETIAR